MYIKLLKQLQEIKLFEDNEGSVPHEMGGSGEGLFNALRTPYKCEECGADLDKAEDYKEWLKCAKCGYQNNLSAMRNKEDEDREQRQRDWVKSSQGVERIKQEEEWFSQFDYDELLRMRDAVHTYPPELEGQKVFDGWSADALNKVIQKKEQDGNTKNKGVTMDSVSKDSWKKDFMGKDLETLKKWEWASSPGNPEDKSMEFTGGLRDILLDVIRQKEIEGSWNADNKNVPNESKD